MEGSLSPIYDSHGKCLGTVLALRDIGCRLEAEELQRRNEERRQRIQKLDAVARVVGGLAQRLNDLLTAILGNTSLVVSMLPETAENRASLNAIEIASNRATELVGRLSLVSTLSGRFNGELQVTNLRRLLPSCIKEIESRLQSHITLTYKFGTDLWTVLVDELLLRQAILELALNSQDAMPQGGTLKLEVDNVTVGEADIGNPLEGQTGEFVRVRISDTGRGMKPTVRARVFEPCFTTKESSGTGLGLALVYSAVRQLHGWIDYSSHANHGTRFDLFFPRYGTGTTFEGRPSVLDKPRAATPTILLCEGEPMVREVGRRILEGEGYRVLTAEDGAQALAVYRQAKDQIDLTILDLNLARLSAYAVLKRLLEYDPGVRVLFSGGYFSEDLTADQGHTLGVIAKPYRRDVLTELVRRVVAVRNGKGENKAVRTV